MLDTTYAKLMAGAEILEAALPANFKWDYSRVHLETNCGTCGCAMGLFAETRFLGIKPKDLRSYRGLISINSSLNALSEAFGITIDEAATIFVYTALPGTEPPDRNRQEEWMFIRHQVQPRHVAAEMRKLAEEKYAP